MRYKGFRLVELIQIIGIVTILAALLFPVFTKAMKAQGSHCQSNMSDIGKAMKMYLSDWDYVYPTNRQYQPSTNPPRLAISLSPTIRMSNPGLTDPQGEPVRFQYGYGWVEGLYPYIERPSVDDDINVWKCPVTKIENASAQGLWASVTYSFNRNLVEKPRSVVKTVSKTMMCREMDRRYGQILRPTNDCAAVTSVPVDPFLDNFPPDSTTFKNLRYRLHGEGSNILFTDGHVENFSTAYFHSTGRWDTGTQQWWNHVDTPDLNSPIRKRIAISP